MTAIPDTSSDATQHIEECARRIEALAERSSAFVRDQLERLRELESRESMAIGIGESSEEAEWRQEQAAWQQQRASEEARIEEQLDHLAHAWRELEAEQRRLLMQGQTVQQNVAERRDDGVGSQTHRPHESLDLVESTGSRSTTSAAFQFQRLKRELRQQSQRHR